MSDEPSDPSPCTWKRKHAVAAQLAAARAKRTCEGGGPSKVGGDEDDSSGISLEAAQEYADQWVLTLPLDERKELAVMLFITFRRRQKSFFDRSCAMLSS